MFSITSFWRWIYTEIKMKLTKKQIKINKKLKHQLTKGYAESQIKKQIKQLDKEWREKLKIEFNDRCIVCNIKNGDTYTNKKGKIIKVKLAGHHLIPREVVKFRHEVLNGVLLCFSCHKYSLECSAHKNPLMFYEFYRKHFKERYDKLVTLLSFFPHHIKSCIVFIFFFTFYFF